MSYENIELSRLMEKEEEILCDIDLYERERLELQLKLHKKVIKIDEYTSKNDQINRKIIELREKVAPISRKVNNIIKDVDIDEELEYNDNEVYDMLYEAHFLRDEI